MPKTANKRYILFAGNLSFETTAEQLKAFLPAEVHSVRLLTKKDGSSRGAAFAEFPDAAALHKALAMTGKALNGRPLRLEPTVGGGGASEKRKDKIKAKKTKMAKKDNPTKPQKSKESKE